MKYLLLYVLTSLMVCCTPVVEADNQPKVVQEYTARITYYYPQPPYGSKVACSKSQYAKEGITVAAHPKFKFGTTIYIPTLKNAVGDGYFTVQDRGTAVTSKRAANGNAYVFDVYVKSRGKLSFLTKTKPQYMKVYVVSNK